MISSVLTLEYSLYGCTRRVASEVLQGLAEGGGSDMVVTRVTRVAQMVAADEPLELPGNCGVVGVLFPVISYKPPPGLVRWLTSRCTRSAGRGRVPVFVVATYGSTPGCTLSRVCQELSDSADWADVVASIVVRCPDTFMWFSPRAGESQSQFWSSAELSRAEDFGREVFQCLSSGSTSLRPEAGILERVAGGVLWRMPYSLPRVLMGDVSVDQRKCTGCGSCSRVCPTRAMGPGSRAPKWDKSRCVGCARCVSVCPANALSVPCSSDFHLLRSYDSLSTTRAPGTHLSRLALRFLRVAAFRRPLATLKAGLMFLLVVILSLVTTLKWW